MSSYRGYPEEEDELDIRVIRQRSRSPAPRYYQEHPYHEPPHRVTRPRYYESHSSGYAHGSGPLLIPAETGLHRSRSHGHQERPVIPPQPQPVIINNRIYNDRDEEDDYHLALAHSHSHHRSRSRSRADSFVSSRDSRDEWELEKTRKELEAFKLEKQRQDEAKRMKEEIEIQKARIKKELELERLRKEKEEEEENERVKEAEKRAVEKYEAKKAEEAVKAEKEKKEREAEYKHRLEDDLRKSGLDEKQITAILKGEKEEKQVDRSRPTYTRMSRKHLSIETLRTYSIEYEFDSDPDYVLIKRWVPEYEQDFLWSHTRKIRECRHPHSELLMIEGKKKKHGEVEFEFVRKPKERKPSPSPLLTFLAGGRR